MTDKLSATQTREILDYLSVDVTCSSADLAFVFGSRFNEPAFIALSLLRTATVPFVVISGGKNPHNGIMEAATYVDILQQEGIDYECLIVEGGASNTRENVQFALPRIAQRIDLSVIKRVIVVCPWYHCRRTMMTLKAQLPHSVHYCTQAFEPYGVPRTDWPLHEKLRESVLKEWQVIPRFLELGHIQEIYFVGDSWV